MTRLGRTLPLPGVVLAGTVGVVALGVWLLAGAPLPGGGGDAEHEAGWPPPAEVVALGRAVYQANCAVCHGQSGEGEPNWKTPNADGTYPAPPHDSTGHTWHHSDSLLSEIVREGGSRFNSASFRSSMPAWGGVLTGEQIEAVIAYLKTLWGPEERAFQAEVSEQDPLPTVLP